MSDLSISSGGFDFSSDSDSESSDFFGLHSDYSDEWFDDTSEDQGEDGEQPFSVKKMPIATCDAGHELTLFRSGPQQGRYTCDGCVEVCDVHTDLYGCRECDFDLCGDCRNHTPMSRDYCNGGHALVTKRIQSLNDRDGKDPTALRCDECKDLHRHPSKMKSCRACDYDVCLKCSFNGKVPRLTIRHYCPNSHALTRFQTHHPHFTCDLCLSDVDQGSTMFGCRDCDYDACIACARIKQNDSKQQLDQLLAQFMNSLHTPPEDVPPWLSNDNSSDDTNTDLNFNFMDDINPFSFGGEADNPVGGNDLPAEVEEGAENTEIIATRNIVSCHVRSYAKIFKENNNFDYAVYVLDVSDGKSTWEVRKRFSELRTMLDNLNQTEKSLDFSDRNFWEKAPEKYKFPQFPPKGHFWSKHSNDEFLSKRRQQLNDFFNVLFSVSHQAKLSEPIFQQVIDHALRIRGPSQPSGEGENGDEGEEVDGISCMSCWADLDAKHGGIVCSNGHHLCEDVCVPRFVELNLSEAQIPARCSDQECNVEIPALQFEKYLSADQHTAYLTIILNSEQNNSVVNDNEEAVNCSACDYMEIWTKSEGKQFFHCGKASCGRVTCLICGKDAKVLGLEAHLECGGLADAKKVFDKALDDGMMIPCPQCGLRGTKDGHCTHMTCMECNALWCYMCGLDEKDCDNDESGNFHGLYRHNEDWKTNPLRCPWYLDYIQEIDDRWPSDSLECVEFFHQMITKQKLKAAYESIGHETYEKVIRMFPSVKNNGFTLEEFTQADLTLIRRQ